MKIKALILIILIVIIYGCAAKKAYFAPFAQEPKSALPVVNKKTDGKQKYKEYKKTLKLYEKEWKLYNKLLTAMSNKKYKEIDELSANIINFHNANKNIISYDEYMNGAEFYLAKSYIYRYEFDKAIEKLNKIPEKSLFYNKALETANRLMSDTDDDGYNDEWELLEGYNPINPYSHP